MQDSFVTEAPRATGARQEENRQTGKPQESQVGKSQQGRSQPESGRRDTQAMTPRVDVLEDETGITVIADMPGVSKESLDIRVENDALSIEGAVSSATPEAMEAMYAEVRTARYRRSFTLSRELDSGRIEAQLKDGVLKVRIPKQEQARPQRISVKVS